MSFECFSGGTQPGGNGGEGGIAGVAGRFAQFSDGATPLDAALNAASVGNIALLWPDDAGLVGVWYKRGASDLVLLGGWADLEQAAAAALAPFNMTSDFVAVRGPDPSLADGGLLLAQNSTVSFAAAGTFPGVNKGWKTCRARGRARITNQASNGQFFGCGFAGNGRTQGGGGAIAQTVATAFYRKVAFNDADLTAALTVAGATAGANRMAPIGSATYTENVSIDGQIWENSQAGLTASWGFYYCFANIEPLHALEGNSGAFSQSAAYTAQTHSDMEMLFYSDNSAAGSTDWVIQQTNVLVP